jgi:hypothetical protein
MEQKQERTGDYRATVCLATTQLGMKLPPFVIFKGKPEKTLEKMPMLLMGTLQMLSIAFKKRLGTIVVRC